MIYERRVHELAFFVVRNFIVGARIFERLSVNLVSNQKDKIRSYEINN